MQIEKRTLKYFFSTEGETEVWYLKRLENLINSSSDSILFLIASSFEVDSATIASRYNSGDFTDKNEQNH